ncbi:hypothetical protein [Micromonospora sp. CA-246542]|uniref:hypothetical protein n=1 Tax=Micromonospora sp. CA-246542 TaxID=3239959 RepID=UPI003D8F02A0
MRSPVNGTAPTSAPGRPAPVVADRPRGLVRRLVLLAVAVGGGFVLALLFQGPASADGTRGGSGDELHRQLGALVEPVRRVTITERSDPDPRSREPADDRRHGGRHAPLAGAIAGVVGARDVPSPTASRRPTDAARTSVPPSRTATSVRSDATRHERLRSSTAARATHRPAHRPRPPRSAADSARRPASAAPDHRELPEALLPPAVAGPLTPVLRPAVDVVRALPIAPLVAALLRVVDAVLPPALGAVVVPAPRSPVAPRPANRPPRRPARHPRRPRQPRRRLRRCHPYAPRRRQHRRHHRRHPWPRTHLPWPHRATSPRARRRRPLRPTLRVSPSPRSTRTPPAPTRARRPRRA